MAKITYKKVGYITFVWVGTQRVGEIGRFYRGAKRKACPTCGHNERYQIVNGYSLRIYDRLWCGGKLVPKNKGGSGTFSAKRKKYCMAKVKELYQT